MKIDCAYDEIIDLYKIIPNPKNANKHSEKQIDMLAKIIDYQGQRAPIVVSKRSGFITKGHGRLAAIQKLGWEKAAVDFQEYESEAQEHADMIADNKIAELAESDALMINELALELPSDFDFELLGIEDFNPIETNILNEEIEDESPAVPKETIIKLGDVIDLGNHRLMCGDSTSIDAVEKLMNGEKADMVFTDPPYGMNLQTDYGSKIGQGSDKELQRDIRDYRPVIGDDKEFSFTDAYALVESVLEQFWFGADYYCDKLPKGGSWMVWDKKTSESLQRMYGSDFELCWSKQKHGREIARVTWASYFGHNKKDDGDSKVHPTMKPVKLIEWFFDRAKGEKVIDLFGGSGSTLIACEKTNRKCFMMELDPHYCDVIISRWCKYTNKNKIKINGEPVDWTVNG